MRAQTLIVVFSSLVAAVAIGHATKPFSSAAQLNAPTSDLPTLAHRGSGRIVTEFEQMTVPI